MRGASILVVEDDDALRERLLRAMEKRGLEATGARCVEEALALAAVESPELAVVDLRLGAGSGLEVVRGLRALDDATRIVVLTGFGSIATAVEAVRLGAVDYLSKPATADAILRALLTDRDAPQRDSAALPIEVPSLARVEWEHIQRVLEVCEGNISQAAKALGLHRRSLQRKLSKNPVRR